MAASIRKPPQLRWPLLVSVLACLAILGLATEMSVTLRATIGERAREGSDNLIHVIGRDIARNIEMVGLSLLAVVDGVGRPDVMALDPAMRRMILFDRAATATSLGILVVYDEEGRLRCDSAEGPPRTIAPVADQEFFRALRQGDPGLFISGPYASEADGGPVIGVSRRISHPDGSFAGVAHATIQVSYFKDLLSKLNLGAKAVVTLARFDGTVLVRQSAMSQIGPTDVSGSPVFRRIRAMGQKGSFVAVSSVDHVERLYTFDIVSDLPLTISLGLPTDEVYADWRIRTIMAGGALILVCLTIIGLTILLTRELHRRSQIELTLAELNAELARLSLTDALTGLGNRRSFDADFGRETRSALRNGHPLCLVLLDVDHFKRFNDHFGHQKGDAALSDIARALAAAAHAAGAIAYRIGGEEFGLIVPKQRAGFAFVLAESIRSSIRLGATPHPASPMGRVTVSLGIGELGDETAERCFARCDAALYQAKHGGRDRTVSAAPASSREQAGQSSAA